MTHSGAVIPFEDRRKEQRASCLMLGASVLFLDIAPASKFDTVPVANFVGKFDHAFGIFDVVYLPLPSYASDHEIVWKAGLAAMRQGKQDRLSVYGYEQPMQYLGCGLDLTLGRVYIPVTGEHAEKKLQLIALHGSQFASRIGDGLYNPAQMMAWMRAQGAHVGVPYAEVVILVRARTTNPD